MRFHMVRVVVAVVVLGGCAGGHGVESGQGVAEAVSGVPHAGAVATGVVSARIRQKSEKARVLELVDGRGSVVATYYPGFFTATAEVPDPETGEPSARRYPGTYFLAAGIEAKSGKVAVAVRGFEFAETSFDMVYVIDTRSEAFAKSKYGPGAFASLPFDGRGNDGELPGAATATRPWLDVVPDSLQFDEAQRVHLTVAHASGAVGEVVYNLGDLSAAECHWTYAGSAVRCPDPTR